MAKISHQKRYAMAVHEVMRRSGQPWKVAAQVYRAQRARLGEPLTQTYFRRLSRHYISALSSEAHKTLVSPLTISQPDFAFDLRDFQGETIDAELEKRSVVLKELTITVDRYINGVFQKTVTRTRSDVYREDFWYTYHEMLRESLETDYDEGISVVCTGITTL